jgi:hypothetical protein
MFSRRPVLREEKDKSKDKKRRRHLARPAADANKHVVKFNSKSNHL